MPAGQTIRTDAMIDEIVERLSLGEPLRQICRRDGMPGWVTVYEWIKTDKELAERIARARDLGFDAIAEQALEIADTPQTGVIEEDSPQGTKVRREDMLGHRRLQVETRLKLLSKWCHRRYGERVEQNVNFTDSTPLSGLTFEEKLAALRKSATEEK